MAGKLTTPGIGVLSLVNYAMFSSPWLSSQAGHAVAV